LWRDTSGGNYCDSLRRLLGVSPPRAFSGPGLRGQVLADGLTPKESLLARRFALVAPLLPQCQGRRSLVGIRRFD